MPGKVRFYWFLVEGKSQFPLDMLRYDCCFPDTGVDVASIDNSYDRELRVEQRRLGVPWRVALVSKDHGPTKERWASFGWRVVDEEIRR